ncbi:TetR/AcrR family transcriptional regulator [Curtobacterium sp. MCBD17_040]|uniref:TetR/AcrR family transcriptional regulator n=1 Tax=Curtobacterium sp. MCBD17_040 TaxID=2175674 RepID=UPI000DAA1F1A|nr:TetR/AcrR family transcriptional regulator [Curtobacterium sp. MCBD17_040]WIB63014.1 TetR family transcriptional regulator [Curtobacterium sp. MCBD17_040]
MPRSGAAARQRLQQAALELYTEIGYDSTTTAQIADRAGVNHRTLFRHFPDKREVLFDGEDALAASLAEAVRNAPDAATPMQALHTAFRASAHVLEANEASGARRLRVIAATPALAERDLAKGAAVASVLAEALRARGTSDEEAGLASVVGWATFHRAASLWLTGPERPLTVHIDEAFDLLAALTTS